MISIIRFLVAAMILVSLPSGPFCSISMAVPAASKPVCAYCGASLPNGVHSSSCPYAAPKGKSSGSNSSRSKGPSQATQMKAMFVGAIFEGLLSSMFAQPVDRAADNEAVREAEQQKAAALAAQYLAQKKAREEEQAAYERMMQSYKQLEGASDVQFKSLSDTALDFKTLDGDMEALAAGARQPFDTPSDLKLPTPPEVMEAPTPFFGDTMATEDVQLLVNPENDPRVVDLRKAQTFIVDNLKTDREKQVAIARPVDKKPFLTAAECGNITQKLNGYLGQRNKFHKTVLLAQEQLNTWEDANRNALVNGVKDGVEYFAGLYLEILKNRGEAADRLRRIYEKKAGEMARNGVDVREIEVKISRLKTMSNVGNFADTAATANDWQTFIKDGMSGLVNQLTTSNQEIKGMLEDPQMQQYFTTEAPELNALLDISKIAASNKALGKWVAKKLPAIAMLEISVKQAYNATDWYLSFKRIADANNINGKVTESAQKLQIKIDETFIQLQQCP